jgi:hypothetical protein
MNDFQAVLATLSQAKRNALLQKLAQLSGAQSAAIESAQYTDAGELEAAITAAVSTPVVLASTTTKPVPPINARPREGSNVVRCTGLATVRTGKMKTVIVVTSQRGFGSELRSASLLMSPLQFAVIAVQMPQLSKKLRSELAKLKHLATRDEREEAAKQLLEAEEQLNIDNTFVQYQGSEFGPTSVYALPVGLVTDGKAAALAAAQIINPAYTEGHLFEITAELTTTTVSRGVNTIEGTTYFAVPSYYEQKGNIGEVRVQTLNLVTQEVFAAEYAPTALVDEMAKQRLMLTVERERDNQKQDLVFSLQARLIEMGMDADKALDKALSTYSIAG